MVMNLSKFTEVLRIIEADSNASENIDSNEQLAAATDRELRGACWLWGDYDNDEDGEEEEKEEEEEEEEEKKEEEEEGEEEFFAFPDLSASFQVIFRDCTAPPVLSVIEDCDTGNMPTFPQEATPPSIVIRF